MKNTLKINQEHQSSRQTIKSTSKSFVPQINVSDEIVDDADTITNEQWKPTPEKFNAYLEREFSMCQINILRYLGKMRRLQSLKDIKGSMIHSQDTVERALLSLLQSKKIKENNGDFCL